MPRLNRGDVANNHLIATLLLFFLDVCYLVFNFKQFSLVDDSRGEWFLPCFFVPVQALLYALLYVRL
ncbi:hypothetical protein CBW18_07160 [Pedobacter sp. AJM]|nr:hypothetical protein CBW18_07160 [Pedobacter sp. AJM]